MTEKKDTVGIDNNMLWKKLDNHEIIIEEIGKELTRLKRHQLQLETEIKCQREAFEHNLQVLQKMADTMGNIATTMRAMQNQRDLDKFMEGNQK